MSLNYSEIKEIIKDLKNEAIQIKNKDILQKVEQLQEMLLDLRGQNLELIEENQSLKSRLNYNTGIQLHNGLIYVEGDSQKYCPKCWGNNRKLNPIDPKDTRFLNPRNRTIPYYWCPACDYNYPIN